MDSKNQIIHKTILNWRFYVGFPLLLLSLLVAMALKLVSIPCKFLHKATKKWSESISYSKRLKKLTDWSFKS